MKSQFIILRETNSLQSFFFHCLPHQLLKHVTQ